MSKIAVFLAQGFEEIEALTVVDLARRAGIDTRMVSISDERRIVGSHEIAVEADACIADTDFAALDMIVLPGGMPGTTNLEACDALCAQVRAFLENGKRVSAICAAPGILGRMGLLDGKTAVCYPSVEPDLKGAAIPQKEVAVDGNLITSRGMGTAITFALAIVEALCGEEKAKALGENIVYEVYPAE